MRWYGVLPLLACASRSEAIETLPTAVAEPMRCSFQERESSICKQLSRGTLLSDNREPLDLVLSECRTGTLTAELKWASRDGMSASYRGVLQFDRPAHPRGALRPAALHPLVLEWPCSHDCNMTVSWARLPVAEQCTSAPRNAQQVELSVPTIDAFSCVGAALLSNGKADWCQRLVTRGNESYVIRGRRGYFMPWERFHIELSANGSIAKVNGKVATVDQLDDLRSQIADLWRAPSEVYESCRDGGHITIEARQTEGWKVLFRSCRHLVDSRVLQSVAAD